MVLQETKIINFSGFAHTFITLLTVMDGYTTLHSTSIIDVHFSRTFRFGYNIA